MEFAGESHRLSTYILHYIMNEGHNHNVLQLPHDTARRWELDLYTIDGSPCLIPINHAAQRAAEMEPSIVYRPLC